MATPSFFIRHKNMAYYGEKTIHTTVYKEGLK